MPITKRYEEQMLLAGAPASLLAPVAEALASAGFRKIVTDTIALRLQAQRKPIVGTLWGDISVTLTDEGDKSMATVVVSAAVDNGFAIARSPGQRLLTLFRDALLPLVTGTVEQSEITPAQKDEASDGSTSATTADELSKLASLRDRGVLTDEEFRAAKGRLLNSL